jgi:ABC-2 type transport system ATP-binding protein
VSGAAIDVDGLTVRYGRRTAVENVTFSVPRGSVYALLGRNGAGKSSIVRCLLGQQKPAAGRVSIFDDDVWIKRRKLMDRLGVVAEESDAPPDMTVAQIGAFCARVYSRWDGAAVDARMRRFSIAPSMRFGNLSKGQKKQVSLAMALGSSPAMLILDDPTLGLDVVARKSLFDEVISELADRGTTILIATHDLGPVETIADRAGVLRAGKLIVDEEIETLKERFRRIRFVGPPSAIEATTLQPVTSRKWGSGTESIVAAYSDDAIDGLRASGSVAEVTPLTLEEIFIAIAGESEGAL